MTTFGCMLIQYFLLGIEKQSPLVNMNSIEKYVSNIGYHFQSLTFDLTYFKTSTQKSRQFYFFLGYQILHRLENI